MSPPRNRLAGETSPYLLQHAGNPVDWHPWDEQALALAKKLDRPIFLSIGYSACHWCHVMEHESFENPDIAAVMNAGFVNIKVDREERPDLDQIYMNAVMALTGGGGWPMSVFLTPDLKPFFGGTYWPPTARWGRPGFREILAAVQDAWRNRRDAVLRQADELAESVIHASLPAPGDGDLAPDVLRHALRSLLRNADRTHGGFGSAPKFPHPMDLRVLLRCAKRFDHAEAVEVATLTLDKMARGGIYDHLGGGFARYSTDERWLVPHFEKMLYDNALLTSTYLEAYQATKNADYARVARETLDYVLREMTQPQGGFCSTQDADSEGVEGKFFVWSEDEVMHVLGPDDGRIFCYCYDVTPQGNWEHHNILHRPKTPQQAAKLLQLDLAELETILARCRKQLFAVRAQRIPPARDDKILVSWNGLMIAAMAQAGTILAEPKYVASAKSAADFILSEMTTDSGRVLHAWKDGRARFNAYLDDYASLIDALIELSQATFDHTYLRRAGEFAATMIARFSDPDSGGFFFTSNDHESLIARTKDVHDNATPSGNSLAATALLKLGRLTGRRDFEEKAVETLRMMAGTLSHFPTAAGQALIALDFLFGPAYEAVLIDGAETKTGDDLLAALYQRFIPNKVVWRQSPEAPLPAELAPLLTGKADVNNQTTLYLCREGTCQAPAVGVRAIESAIDSL
jgi:uncharacterized protein YyaL (SSP411 family)